MDNNRVARLTSTQVEDLVDRYQNKGWHIMHLSRYYRMPHASIQHHLVGVTRMVPPIDHCPEEVVEASAHVSGWKVNRGRLDKTYEDYVAEDARRREKKRHACRHPNLVVLCRCCGEHFEETKTREARVKVIFI